MSFFQNAESLSNLISYPLIATINADTECARGTAEFIRTMGFKQNDLDPENFGEPIMLNFSYNTYSPDGGVIKNKFSIPLLSILSIPALRVDTVDLDFTTSLVEVVEETTANGSKISRPYAKLSNDNNTKTTSSSDYKMKISARSVDNNPGLDSLISLLSNSVFDNPTEDYTLIDKNKIVFSYSDNLLKTIFETPIALKTGNIIQINISHNIPLTLLNLNFEIIDLSPQISNEVYTTYLNQTGVKSQYLSKIILNINMNINSLEYLKLLVSGLVSVDNIIFDIIIYQKMIEGIAIKELAKSENNYFSIAESSSDSGTTLVLTS